MRGKRLYLLDRGYGFLVRSVIAGEVVNALLARSRGVYMGNNSAVMPGAIVTEDIEEGTVAGGNPAALLMTVEDSINHWNEGMREHPEQHCDCPSLTRPPTTPWEDIITWLYGVIYCG